MDRAAWRRVIAALCWVALAPTHVIACPSAPTGDWLATAPALAMPVSPRPCQTVDQTPPQFSWPDVGARRYQLELRDATGRIERHVVERNWLLPERALAAGDYAWRVRPLAPTQRGPGQWRHFTIAEDAVPFVVPPSDALSQRAQSRPRPRAFPVGAQREAYLAALTDGAEHANWQAFLTQVRARWRQPRAEAPDAMRDPAGDRKTYARQGGDSKRLAGVAIERMLDSALAWQVTGERIHLADARVTLLTLATWDPRGATGVNHHQVAGRMLWSMALTLDWLWPELSAAERRQVIDVLARRMDDLIDEFGIHPRRKLDKMPFNSHAWVALGEMAAAAALLVGEHPRAGAWFDVTVRPFLFLVSPWGGMDGGLGNGLAYGVWDALALTTPLDILKLTLDVDPYRKGWSRALGRSLAYFHPPGAAPGGFGDGLEKSFLPGDVADLARLHARRSGDAWMRWYARRAAGRRPPGFAMLFPPAEAVDAPEAPPDMAPTALFESVGWVAMHSDLADPDRTSVYFKSSPYGAFSHSHADQNSFTLHARGRPILIDAGYYDYHGSAHGRAFYRQTRAHNAITHDDGQGQRDGDRAAGGRIVDFRHSDRVDHVTGDATAAYAGALTQALRTVIFLRPYHVVVYDALAAPQPRRWEWNAHAHAPFRRDDDGRLWIEDGPVTLCMDAQASGPLHFEQTGRFPVEPDLSRGDAAAAAPQWHARLVSADRSTEAALLVVLSLRCNTPPPSVEVLGQRRYRLRHEDLDLVVGPRGVE